MYLRRVGPSVSGLFQGLPHYGPGEKVIDNTYYGQIKSFFSLAANSRLLSQRAHDTEVQGYRVFTGKSHNTHNGIILKYLSGKPATIFFDYTSSRNFGYASGTCEWLFKELGPEKHLGTHKMELRQGQDNMASSPLLYSEAFESITSGT